MKNRFRLPFCAIALLLTAMVAGPLSGSVVSGTFVSGAVTGEWTQAQSPYYVTGNLIVPSNTTLTISAGVSVVFQGHYYIQVDGTLCTLGTTNASVLITAQDHTSGWAGMRIIGNTNNNTFVYTVFEYGRTLGSYVPPYHTPNMEGAGVYMDASKATFDHCVFSQNSATVHGAAVSVWGASDIVMMNSGFYSNMTVQGLAGYGAFCLHGSPDPLQVKVLNCEFAYNIGSDQSSAISFRAFDNPYPPIQVINNVFHHNLSLGNWESMANGVALFSGGEIYNNTFYGNTLTASSASAPMIWLAQSNRFINNIIFDNTVPGATFVYQESASSVVQYNNIQGGYEGVGNIDANPMFVDASNFDFHLQADSPCIDAGDAAVLSLSLIDRDGQDRLTGNQVDMGAYETKFYATLIIGGNPEARGTSQPYNYGTNLVAVSATEITSTVTSPVPGGSGMQYVCIGWSGAGSVPAVGLNDTASFVLAGNSELTWNWQTQFQLATAVSGGGDVTPADGWYADGSNVVLTATADPNWHFVEWTGDTNGCETISADISVPMTQARALTALFELDNGTFVAGAVTGEWTQAQSPYYVTGNLIVPSNTTLTISAGVSVVFQGHYYIQVDGTLCTLGTTNASVLITAQDHTSGWAGMRIIGNTNNNTFAYTVFEYGRALGAYEPPIITPNMEGAAVYMDAGKATFDHCVFSQNSSTVHGSAVSVWGASDIVMTYSGFYSNMTVQGLAGYGAFGLHGSPDPIQVKVLNCEFAYNTGQDQAAAISFRSMANPYPPIQVINNVFHHNQALGNWESMANGVALFSGGEIYNNTFYSNTLTASSASAPLIWLAQSNRFINNIIFDNTVPGATFVYQESASSVVQYNNIQGGYAGVGNIDANPMFADASNLDFHLQTGSPCIDAGDDSVLSLSLTDRDGLSRLSGNHVDMGAYEASIYATLLVGGNPLPWGTVTPYNYGTHLVATSGTVITNTVTSPVSVGSGTQYVCTGWSGTGSVPAVGSGNTANVTLTENSELTWNWQTQYQLATAVSGGGDVTPADGWYADGSNVVLTATADPNWHFVRWAGDTNGCLATFTSLNVPITRPRTITAVFAGGNTPTISGRVTRFQTKEPLECVTITFSGSLGATISDTNGNYSMLVPFGWSGTATASYGSGGFTKPTLTFRRVMKSQTKENFVWAPDPVISGRVWRNDTKAGMPGVTITADHGGGVTTTDGSGNYSLTVPYNWTGVITPSVSDGGKFSPGTRAIQKISQSRRNMGFVWKPTASHSAPRSVSTGSMAITSVAAGAIGKAAGSALVVHVLELAQPAQVANGDLATVMLVNGQAQVCPVIPDAISSMTRTFTLESQGADTNNDGMPDSIALALGDNLREGVVLLTIQCNDGTLTATTPFVELLSVEGPAQPLGALPATWRLR